MKTTLGGMRVASPPPAATLPSASLWSYFLLSISGSAISPKVTISAPMMPTIEAMMALAMMVPTAIPPRSPPAHTLTARKSWSAMPARCSSPAMSTKSGTDMRV